MQWAKSYLIKAGLLQATKRAHFRASSRGLEILNNPPPRIDIAYLRKWPEFVAFRETRAITDKQHAGVEEVALTPDENMRRAYTEINDALGQDLLQRIHAAPPAFFEALTVKLLVAMGYGGSIDEAGRALGKTGDGGVDGVIDQDELGLDRIYVQAKRYNPETAVGPGAIRDFFGALDQFKASKGLFVTTSTFSQTAVQTASGLSKRIVLIDGSRLARLMIQHDVGCRMVEQMSIRRVDEEFFEI